MKILILGGNSKRHYEWIRKLGAHLVAAGHEVILHDYRHWATGDEWADADYELARLAELMDGERDYIIVAKSIGTVITVLGVKQGILHPMRCVLLGIPYNGVVDQVPEFDEDLKLLPSTVVLQHEYDPYGSAEDIAKHLELADNPAINLAAMPGNTHDYTDFALIERLLKEKE
jgi:hypothetical protein